MQTARQSAQHRTKSEQSSRSRMIAAIQITWKYLRPDLHHSPEELREERLAYITDVLKTKRPVTSLRALSDRQLSLALDALKKLEAQPRLPNCETEPTPTANTAQIIHLASAEQVFTITKLFEHLGWSLEAREQFTFKRFRRNSPSMMSPSQAHSLTMILLNIAAARAVKERTGVTSVSRPMIHAEIPALKARLGIDKKESDR